MIFALLGQNLGALSSIKNKYVPKMKLDDFAIRIGLHPIPEHFRFP